MSGPTFPWVRPGWRTTVPRAARPIFTAEWQAGGARAVGTAMPATLRLFRKNPERIYDPETNTYIDDPIELYEGKGRVQPLRSSRFEPAPMDSAYWQTVLLSVPIAPVLTVDFRVADQARVLVSPLNPAILKYQYMVNEIIDSSNPFERTLLCTVSLEATTG